MEDPFKDINDEHIQMTNVHSNKPAKIEPSKVLNINDRLDRNQ